MRCWPIALVLLAAHAGSARAEQEDYQCAIPRTTVAFVQKQLYAVDQLNNGGIFSPNRMWSAVVDRKGVLCSVVVDGDAWPGSRDIAIAKAHTANGFSNSALSLSTAMLYSAVQPGGSLYGLNNSNPFNPAFNPQGTGVGAVPGGVITFGGGVALYSGGQVIGGLGVSGDSSCADHTIAFRMRQKAGLDTLPSNGSDNIQYLAPGEAPNGFKHPHCFASDVPAAQVPLP